ncbi:hypothetical protein ANTPLA_LOCUS8639 [Anthophora plagiata]
MRSVRRIKHSHLGIDTSREGLDPIPRRDCEQRTASWSKRTEKCGETSWKWDSESDEVFITSVTSLTYSLRLLTRYVLKTDPSIPPKVAKLRRKRVFHRMVDHFLCKWQLYSDVVYKVLHFRHSLFFIPGIT